MIKGIIVGIILGVIGVFACVYSYFATGHAPVSVSAPDMPFERTFAQMGLHAYLNKLPHPEPVDALTYARFTGISPTNCLCWRALPRSM